MSPEQRTRRFWAQVIRLPDDHWHWGGYGLRDRYGGFYGLTTWDGGKKRYVDRIAWVLTHGYLADEDRLHRRCDDHECINPAHRSLD